MGLGAADPAYPRLWPVPACSWAAFFSSSSLLLFFICFYFNLSVASERQGMSVGFDFLSGLHSESMALDDLDTLYIAIFAGY